MENIFQRWGKNFPYVGKKFSAGGEKIFRDSSTANNTATTTASESPAPLEPRHEAAAAESQMQQLKAALLAVDRRLVFDRSFYPRAAAFMRSRRLDARYLSWLLRECLNRNPRSLSGLFFKLFFAENIAEQFALLHAPPPEREKAFSDCPGCGTPRESGSACPECGLDPADCEDDVRRIRQIYALPEGRRKNYFQRRKAIVLKTCADGGASFAEMRERVKTLDAEFGIASSA
jgi:hypothetical protein